MEVIEFVGGLWLMSIYDYIDGMQLTRVACRPATPDEIPNTREGILDIIGVRS